MNTYSKTNFDIVQFTSDDIVGLIELSSSVGWDYDENEIRTVMLSGKVFGHKNTEGEIVSSAAIIPYDNHLASIGMVIVNNKYRGMGLGELVTRTCIESVPKETSIMLISTEQGKPLYQKLGFKTVDCVHKFLCDRYSSTDSKVNKEVNIKKYKKEDFQNIVGLDSSAFGDVRTRFLMNRIEQAEKCVVVRDLKGKVIGYGLSILGPINLIIGPIVAPDSQIASLIVNELVLNHQGRLRIDVPSGKNEFMLNIEKSGFVKVNEPPVMIRNSMKMPFRNQELFAIAAQVFG